MTWFWFVAIPLLIVVLALAIGWWARRKPDADEAERAYLAQADARREAQRRSVDRSGF